MSGRSPERIVVIGTGEGAGLLATALARDEAPTDLTIDLVADPSRLEPILAREAGLIVEAAPDSDPDAKAAVLRTLLDDLPARVPIAVATRLLTLDTLLPASRHGARVVGLHPIHGSSVVEIAMPAQFDDGVVDGVLALLEGRGFVALPCGDAPGRIVDRLLATAWLEVRAAAARGTPAAVIVSALADAGIALGAVAEADLAPILAVLHAGLGEPSRYAPALPPAGGAPPDAASLADRLALAAIAEGYRLVEEAVAGAEEIERAVTAGARWAAGPFTLAGRRGLRGVVTALVAIARDPAEDDAARDRFAVPQLLWTMATV